MQIPAAESILGCISSMSKNYKAFRNVARTTGTASQLCAKELTILLMLAAIRVLA